MFSIYSKKNKGKRSNNRVRWQDSILHTLRWNLVRKTDTSWKTFHSEGVVSHAYWKLAHWLPRTVLLKLGVCNLPVCEKVPFPFRGRERGRVAGQSQGLGRIPKMEKDNSEIYRRCCLSLGGMRSSGKPCRILAVFSESWKYWKLQPWLNWLNLTY